MPKSLTKLFFPNTFYPPPLLPLSYSLAKLLLVPSVYGMDSVPARIYKFWLLPAKLISKYNIKSLACSDRSEIILFPYLIKELIKLSGRLLNVKSSPSLPKAPVKNFQNSPTKMPKKLHQAVRMLVMYLKLLQLLKEKRKKKRKERKIFKNFKDKKRLIFTTF